MLNHDFNQTKHLKIRVNISQNRCSFLFCFLFCFFFVFFLFFFCFFLSYNKLFLFHSFIVLAILFNMLHRKYFFFSFSEYKRFFKHISTRNLSTSSMYKSKSKRKHVLTLLKTFDTFILSQNSSSESNDEYFNISSYTLKFSTSEKTITLKKIWEFLFDEDD